MSRNMICISACERSGTCIIATILLSMEDQILEEVIEHRQWTCFFNIVLKQNHMQSG